MMKTTTDTEKTTPLAAAERIAEAYRALGFPDAKAWDADKCRETGWTTADAAVVCEGATMAEDQVRERGPWADCPESMQPFDGVFAEPYSEWLMCFYARGNRLNGS